MTERSSFLYVISVLQNFKQFPVGSIKFSDCVLYTIHYVHIHPQYTLHPSYDRGESGDAEDRLYCRASTTLNKLKRLVKVNGYRRTL